jgi:hypothetical protein
MKENKIVVEKNNSLNLKDEKIILDLKCNDVILNIEGKVIINEIVEGIDNRNIKINLNKNSKLTYNRFCRLDSGKCLIDVKNLDNSIINFNNSFITTDKYELIINNEFICNNSNSRLNIKGVSVLNGLIKVIVNGIVKEKTLDNELLEDIRILTLNNNEHIITPNMMIDSENVVANHNVAISGVSDIELFYLNSKGLSYEKSVELIKNGFLLKNMELIPEIKQILNS